LETQIRRSEPSVKQIFIKVAGVGRTDKEKRRRSVMRKTTK
jgi:hypothetical protein